MGVLLIVRLRVTPTIHPLAAVLAAIPPVLDSIVTSTIEAASNLGPTLSNLPHQLIDLGALLRGDGLVVKTRLQVLVIALAALLGCPGSEGLGNSYPVEGAMGVDKFHQVRILGVRPRTSSVTHRHDCETGRL
jgi:hypothetical protein